MTNNAVANSVAEFSLDAQKETLHQHIKNIEHRISSNREILSLKKEGNSEDDISSLYEMQAKAQSAITSDESKLKEIRIALRRIEDDDYEFCVSCGNDIGERRLLANPVATKCIDCATYEFEKQRHYR